MGYEHHFLMFSFNSSKLKKRIMILTQNSTFKLIYISKLPNEIPISSFFFVPSLPRKPEFYLGILFLLPGLQTDRGLLLGEEPHILQLSGSHLICFWRTELGFLDSRYRLNNDFLKVSNFILSNKGSCIKDVRFF